MGAKFRFIGEEEQVVEVQEGTFTAEPDTVYEVRGKTVLDLTSRDDFEREHPTASGEVPTWQSPS